MTRPLALAENRADGNPHRIFISFFYDLSISTSSTIRCWFWDGWKKAKRGSELDSPKVFFEVDMYTKILAAFDLSSRGKQVFEAALTLAKANHADLMLLHVLSRDAEDSPGRYSPNLMHYQESDLKVYRQEWEDFVKKSDKLLESLIQQAIAEGVKAEFRQREGSPGKTICDFAHEWDADLIVIGRRGYSSASEMFIGSVSSYIIHRCNCSVHIVQ